MAQDEPTLDLDSIQRMASRAALDETWRQEAASPDEVMELVQQARRLRIITAGLEQLCRDGAEYVRLDADDPPESPPVLAVAVQDIRRILAG